MDEFKPHPTLTPRIAIRWPFLSEDARQRIREQFTAMKASMDAFGEQLRQVAETARMGRPKLERLSRLIHATTHRARRRDAALGQLPRSPFGFIVDLISVYPTQRGPDAPPLPPPPETVEAAIERLANSSTWSRGQLRYMAEVFQAERLPNVPRLMEHVINVQAAGVPLDPHMLIQIARAV